MYVLVNCVSVSVFESERGKYTQKEISVCVTAVNVCFLPYATWSRDQAYMFITMYLSEI